MNQNIDLYIPVDTPTKVNLRKTILLRIRRHINMLINILFR